MADGGFCAWGDRARAKWFVFVIERAVGLAHLTSLLSIPPGCRCNFSVAGPAGIRDPGYKELRRAVVSALWLASVRPAGVTDPAYRELSGTVRPAGTVRGRVGEHGDKGRSQNSDTKTRELTPRSAVFSHFARLDLVFF